MNIIAFLLVGLAAPGVLRLEAEDAVLTGATVASARPGFSGTGYAAGMTEPNARIVWRAKASAGVYVAKVAFCTQGGQKGFEIGTNGAKFGGMFPAVSDRFAVHDAGKVELKDGENEISIERGWGYFDIDYLELSPAPPPAPLLPVPATLVDPKASPEARALFGELVGRYGKETLSGQYDMAEANWVARETGRYPAILGGDFMDYSPSRVERGSLPKNVTESYVRAAKSGMVLTLSWHWNAPKDLRDRVITGADGREIDQRWYRGFYTEATTFDVEKALADPSSEDYRLILRDIDAIAVELKKLADARVPVLWRPLHEAEGGWFWWGAKGPEPCKKLWRLLFDRLTGHHGLHNLIWVWNSEAESWYPGDDVVDIVSIDSYPGDRTDPLVGAWDRLLARFNGRKMLGLAEFPGAPDVDRMARFGVRWSFFVSWTGSVGPKSTPIETLRRVYRSDRVVTDEERKKPR